MGIRVHQLAKDIGISSKELVRKLKGLKIKVSGHMTSLDEKTAQVVKQKLKVAAKKQPEKKRRTVKEKRDIASAKAVKIEEKKFKKEVSVEKTPIIPVVVSSKPEEIVLKKEPTFKKLEVGFPLTTKDLALKLQLKPSQLISDLIKRNIFVTLNQNLEENIAKEISKNYGYELTQLPSQEELILAEHEKIDIAKLIPRAPVVTFMGHVDHGKTSLLDMIRKTKVADKEAGGITQHIGAYQVNFKNGKVTFLDTPGHEAFTAMRARGANVTDVVVLVVAADDGVKPQTIEAVDHARAAGVPIIVAINKIDKPQADIEKTKKQLADLNLLAEDWGGKTIVVGVSAKTGEGIDRLLEMLLLEAEMLELKANPSSPAKGVVIESKLTQGSGPIANVLVQNGTLKISNTVICGKCVGKIKALINDKGQRIKEAGPAMPVEILGLDGVVKTGDMFYVVEDEKKAKEIASAKEHREKEQRLLRDTGKHKISLEDLYKEITSGHIKELKLVAKADVQGSLEALIQSLEKLSTEKVKLKVIHGAVGAINESDILLAAASDAIVIGFHIKIEPGAKKAAFDEGVDVKIYNIIYEVISDVKAAMEGLLEPKLHKVFVGRVEVKQVFKLSKAGVVAGCFVTKGKIIRGEPATVYRNKEIVFEGRIDSLKHFKNDVREVSEDRECGISFSNFKDIKVGDIIECYHIEKILQKL